MKIKRLHLTNFRLHSDSTLDTEDAKFVILRGKNFSGKTSVAEGISLALTPTTKGLDGRGAGFVRKIKRGTSKAILEVDLQGANRTIRRTVSLNLTASGRTQKSEDLADSSWNPVKFDALLDAKKTALGIAINTQQFQSMIYAGDEKAQKSLLAQLVLPARYEFPKETIEDVDSLLGEGTINFSGEPFAVIETAYKKLFADRQEANRCVKDFVVPDALQRPQGVNLESLKTQLEVLREDRKKQSAERDAASKKANEEALKGDRAKARIETLEAVLKASREALNTLQGDMLPDPATVQEVAGRKAERTRLLADQERYLSGESAAKKEADRLNELSKVGASCPTCDQEIDEAKLVELMSVSVAERTQWSEAYEKVVQEISALGDIDDAVSKLEKHTKALAEKDEVSAKIEENTRALKQARTEAEGAVSGLFESATFDSAISKTDKDIETILTQIQPVIAAEERDKEIETKKGQLKRLEDKASKLDRLVKFFDKDGIKAKLIADFIGGFEHKVNEVLSAWDYSCSVSIEPFRFEVTDYRKVATPLIELSGAEEIMFYAAFQCAVSRTAGIGFVVIDRVDTLLPDLRPALFKNLHKMVTEGTLDQVILLIADTSEQVPKIPDSAFFYIEEGSIRRLG